MKKITIFLFLFVSILTNAQTFTLNGKVVNENKEPLPGATILVKEANKGTSTDFDGKFLFEVVDGTYLIELSYVGYETQQITEINIAGAKEFLIDVTLNPSSNSLDEVVVTTSQRKNSEVAILAIQKKKLKHKLVILPIYLDWLKKNMRVELLLFLEVYWVI